MTRELTFTVFGVLSLKLAFKSSLLGSLLATDDWRQNLLDVYDDRHQDPVKPDHNPTPCIRLAMAFREAIMEEIKNKLTSTLVYNCDLEFTAAYAGEKRRDFVDFCPDCTVLRFPFRAPQHSGTSVEAIVHAAMNRWGSRWDYHADCGHPVGCAEFYWDLVKVSGVFTCVFNKTGFHDSWGQCSFISTTTRSPIDQNQLL